MHLVKEAELDAKFNYIVGSHPHGILCSGAFCNFATEGTQVSRVFPGITFTLTTLSCQYIMPFYREFFMTSGAVTSSKKSIDFVLSSAPSGNAIVLVVGGAPESLDTHPDVDNIILILKPRKGFVKMALKHGLVYIFSSIEMFLNHTNFISFCYRAHLVPSFSFGENQVYDQVNNPRGSKLRKFQDYLQKTIGLAPVLIKGRGIFQYSFGIIPHRRPITTVGNVFSILGPSTKSTNNVYFKVGKPIFVKRTENPTEDEINQLHSKYVQELMDLFERHKSKYYSNNVKIHIV